MVSSLSDKTGAAEETNSKNASPLVPKVEISGRHRGIKHIDLSRFIPSSSDILLLHRITHFDLSHNELRVLKDLHPLRHLQHLDVSHNRISCISNLPSSIVKLNLSHNELSRLVGLSDLSSLKELNVNFNALTNLTGLHPRIPLKALSAEHNRIQRTLGLDEMDSLEVLSLRHNHIKETDELYFLPSCPSLRVLSLEGNPIGRHQQYHSFLRQLRPSLQRVDGVWCTSFAGNPSEEGVGGRPWPSHPTQQGTGSEDWDALADDAARRRQQSTAAVKKVPHHPTGTTNTTSGATPSAEEEVSRDAPFTFFFQPEALAKQGSSGRTPTKEKAEGDGAAAYATLQKNTVSKDIARTPVDASFSLSTDSTEDVRNCSTSATAGSSEGGGYARAFEHTMRHASVKRQHVSPSALTPASSSTSFSFSAIRPAPSPLRTGTFTSTRAPTPSVKPVPVDSMPSASPPLCSSDTPQEAAPHYSITAQLHDALVGKEQAEKENTQLRLQVKKLNDAVRANRRLVGDLTRDISELRVECQGLKEAKEKDEALIRRLRRNLQAIQQHHQTEIRSLQAQCERLRIRTNDSLEERKEWRSVHYLQVGPDQKTPDEEKENGRGGRGKRSLLTSDEAKRQTGTEKGHSAISSSLLSATPVGKRVRLTRVSSSGDVDEESSYRLSTATAWRSIPERRPPASGATGNITGTSRAENGKRLPPHATRPSFLSTDTKEEEESVLLSAPSASTSSTLRPQGKGPSLEVFEYTSQEWGSGAHADDWEEETEEASSRNFSQKDVYNQSSLSSVVEVTEVALEDPSTLSDTTCSDTTPIRRHPTPPSWEETPLPPSTTSYEEMDHAERNNTGGVSSHSVRTKGSPSPSHRHSSCFPSAPLDGNKRVTFSLPPPEREGLTKGDRQDAINDGRKEMEEKSATAYAATWDDATPPSTVSLGHTKHAAACEASPTSGISANQLILEQLRGAVKKKSVAFEA